MKNSMVKVLGLSIMMTLIGLAGSSCRATIFKEAIMKSSDVGQQIYLGYDPGGKQGNGVAIITTSGNDLLNVKTATFDSVDEALNWFLAKLDGDVPVGIGIDAFLYWDTGLGGWRVQDRWLRERYPLVKNSVLSSNSTFGSMAVQGMAMAIRVRQLWPGIALNEAHPKVQHYALWHKKYPHKSETWPNSIAASETIKLLSDAMAYDLGSVIFNDHEWDAVISAWTTCMGMSGRWNNNLIRIKNTANGEPTLIFPAGKEGLTYYWPSD